MKNRFLTLLVAVGAVLTWIDSPDAHGDRLLSWRARPQLSRFHKRDRSFQRIATFANYRNNPPAALGSETVAEITAASADGRTLVYTDGLLGEIGFIDITNPANPEGTGKLAFASGHEPTSVDILGNTLALVAVDSSASFTTTSGYVAVVDIAARTIVRQIDLGGQPDSIRISPDGKYAAVVIENERDEALCAGGSQGGFQVVETGHLPGVNTTEDLCEAGGGVVGGIPQTPYGNPAGFLVVLGLTGPTPFSWSQTTVALTGIADVAPTDPEPEFVDINNRNQAVVSLQENNHMVIVDLKTATVVQDFPAGAVHLSGIDATEDGVIDLSDSLPNVPREPDAVAWVPGFAGLHTIATANEGDLNGGSRGFTLFRPNGTVVFDSGSSFEALAVEHGHYPEDRSENKGTEPEAIEYARFGYEDYLFVGSERGGFIAVYRLNQLGRPVFEQLLPAPFGPEGLRAIPGRNLLIASGEEDAPSFGVRSTIMIYQLRFGEPSYPQIVSAEDGESPISWSALSGMTSLPWSNDTLLAVWDGYYSESRVLRIDTSATPAVITDSTPITGGTRVYDPEGIAYAPDRTVWIASEGNAADTIPNLLVQLNADGQVLREVGLPAAVLACRAATANRGTLGSGFEGVSAVRTSPGRYTLIVAQQRGWDYTSSPECEAIDDDEGGLNSLGEPNRTRLWIYDPFANAWTFVAWELAPRPANASWVGLSEITDTPTGDFIVIERDNRTGDFAALKTLVRIRASALTDGAVAAAEKDTFNLLPALKATKGWITDKPEGTAVMPNGRLFVVTDNDGVEGWSGETGFFELGPYWRLFN